MVLSFYVDDMEHFAALFPDEIPVSPPKISFFSNGPCPGAATYFANGGKVGKTPPGTAPDEHFVLIVAFPRTPVYGGRQLGDMVRHRKGAGGSADWFPFYDRCR